MLTYKKKQKILIEYIQSNKEKLYRLAYSYVKDEQLAMDVIQESIEKSLTSLEQLKNPDYIGTWMYRIVVNTSVNLIRKNKKIIYMDDVPERSQKEEVGIDEKMDLYEAIDKLKEDYKTVIMLRYFEDLTLNDIAEITEVPLSTVKTRIYTAIRQLKKLSKCEVS